MPELSGRTLALAIQAVDREMRRLEALPEDVILPDEQVLEQQYHMAAQELKTAYAEATKTIRNLPPYSRLVHPRD